jgi:hypothetical protein
MPACDPLRVVGGAKKGEKASAGRWAAGEPLAPASAALYLDAYQLFAEYTTGVVDARTMAEYGARLDQARRRERGYLLFRAAAAVKNHRQFSFSASRRYGRFAGPRGPRAGPAPLTYLYDEEGFRHSWASRGGGQNLYVYTPGGAGQSLGALVAALAESYRAGAREGPNHGRALVDVQCPTCGTLLSEVHKLDPRKAEGSLRALAEFEMFFSFYSSRCPNGGLHDFDLAAGGGGCRLCGVSEALLFGYGTPRLASAARAYYDRFFETYREQRTTVGGPAAELFQAGPAGGRPIDPASVALERYRGFAEGWKPDYSLVVRAAELAGVPVAALETLGATEKREYADVLAGVGAPPPPVTRDDPRLLAVDSVVRVFVSDYNRLRFVGRFAKPPPEVGALLAETQVPPHEYAGLASSLPDVYEDYGLRRLAFLLLRPPEDVLLFSIETLARMALGVAAAAGPEWLAALGAGFAGRELRAIVRGERLLAKNGPFSFKIFGDDDLGVGALGQPDEPADDFGDPGEDVLSAIEAAGGEDGAYDPFSLEGVDLDADDPNLEPD